MEVRNKIPCCEKENAAKEYIADPIHLKTFEDDLHKGGFLSEPIKDDQPGRGN
jgi:hypothetical protein